MAAYVIKTWRAQNTPAAQGNFVSITGRKVGIISWFFSMFGLDPTVTITVSASRVEFSMASLAGTMRRIIPLSGVCSTVYGYHKPWKQATALVSAFAFFSIPLAQIFERRSRDFPIEGFLIGLVLGVLIAAIYYLLNKTLIMGFVEHSGLISAIEFKRSMIENVAIDEQQAGFVCQLTQYCIEAQQAARR